MKKQTPFKSLTKRTGWLICLFGLITVHAGGDLSGMPGAFAPMDLGAQSSGLAGAQTASPCVSEALLHNPAALFDASWSGGYSFSNAYSLLPHHFLSGSFRMGVPLALGLSVIQNGDEVYSENQIMLGAAISWRNLRTGISWKLRFASTGSGGEDFLDPESGENTKVSGRGIGLAGFDVGVKGIFWKNRFVAGVVLKDLLSAVAWSTENEAETAKGKYMEFVPISMKFGMQAVLPMDVMLNIDIEPGLYHLPKPFDFGFLETYSDIKNRLLIGLEWVPLQRMSSIDFLQRLLAIRCGYGETIFEEDKSKKFTFGMGLAFPVASKGNYRVAIDGGYQINTIFSNHNSFRVGVRMQSH